jgi:hypothetical protein
MGVQGDDSRITSRIYDRIESDYKNIEVLL